MTTLSIAIPNDLSSFLDQTIAEGQAAGPSELIALALYALRDQVELDRIKDARLRSEIAVGMKQIERGKFSDYDQDEFLAEMNLGLAKRAA